VALQVAPRTVNGVWFRHVPHRAHLLGRASVPSDGRWQHGDVVPGLYLADSIETATAEWYRSLAEWGLAPQDHIPYDHHEWRLDLRLADLSDVERLRRVELSEPLPDRRTWPAFQRVGEQLWREGWAGLVVPSAARPVALVACVFAGGWPPDGCEPIKTSTVVAVPPPPRRMRT
jgi:RES domain-containing protein